MLSPRHHNLNLIEEPEFLFSFMALMDKSGWSIVGLLEAVAQGQHLVFVGLLAVSTRTASSLCGAVGC